MKSNSWKVFWTFIGIISLEIAAILGAISICSYLYLAISLLSFSTFLFPFIGHCIFVLLALIAGFCVAFILFMWIIRTWENAEYIIWKGME